jgi:hypothetical protein
LAKAVERPIPQQAAVRGIDLSSYEVTGDEENEGGECSEAWHSWPREYEKGGGKGMRVDSAKGMFLLKRGL